MKFVPHRPIVLLLLPLLLAVGCNGEPPATSSTRYRPKAPTTSSTGPANAVTGAAAGPAPVVNLQKAGERPLRPVGSPSPTPVPAPLASLAPSYPTIAAQPVTINPAAADAKAGILAQNFLVLSMSDVSGKADLKLSVRDGGVSVAQDTTAAGVLPPATLYHTQSVGQDFNLGLRRFEDTHIAPLLGDRPKQFGIQQTATPLAVGALVPFYVITSFDSANYQDVKVSARVTEVGQHCYVLVDQDVEKSAADAQSLAARAKSIADTFDSAIYPTDTRIFGSEPNPGVDGDPRLFILISPAVGNYGQDNTLGFFSQRDVFKPTSTSSSMFKHSNAKEMLYVSSRIVLTGATDDYMGTIAHEFQHMINFNQKVLVARNRIGEDLWIDEGMAMYAIEANGYGLKAGGQVLANHVKKFQQEPGSYSLIDWDNNPDKVGYGPVYLFMVYLADRFGEGIINEIVTSAKLGIPNIDAVLRPRGETFNRVFHDWCMANLVDPVPQNTLHDYRYGTLHMVGANGSTKLAGFATEPLAVPGEAALMARPYSMHFFQMPQGPLAPRFTLDSGSVASSVPRLILPNGSNK